MILFLDLSAALTSIWLIATQGVAMHRRAGTPPLDSARDGVFGVSKSIEQSYRRLYGFRGEYSLRIASVH